MLADVKNPRYFYAYSMQADKQFLPYRMETTIAPVRCAGFKIEAVVELFKT